MDWESIYNTHQELRFKLGFTLVEVLIALTIIGIIAALTIPSIVTNMQDQQYKTAYKKAFADGQAAFIAAKNNDELVPMPNVFDLTSAQTNWQAFKSKFIVVKVCESGTDNGDCWDQTAEHVFGNTYPRTIDYAFIDNQGRAWSIYNNHEAIVLCDVNSFKPPNKYGKDRWLFTFADANNNRSGTFVKFRPMVLQDLPNINADWCPSGKCYYISWLTN